MSGAGVLYQTRIHDTQLPEGFTLQGGRGRQPKPEGYLTFGSSGFLYRSNKLMYDRQTDTLWYQLWGTPAFGALVGSGLELRRLPVTLTTWKAWQTAHPDTKVMAFDTGHVRDYSVGAAYQTYFNSPDTMFPVWRRSDRLPTKSWVFTLLIDGKPKAYPLELVAKEGVLNDTLAGQPLVVIHDAGGHGARAYARGKHFFRPLGVTPSNVLRDAAGQSWHVDENALAGPAGEKLARLPGHMAFWFGWYGFYPQTEVYAP